MAGASLAIVASTAAVGGEVDPAAATSVRFADDVLPILRKNCGRCHGAKTHSGGLQIDRRASALAAGDSGEPIVVPGEPEASLLIRRVVGDADGDRMPPDSDPLSGAQIEKLRRWIEQGAPWPDALAEPKHWSYAPIVRPAVPSGEAANPIDRFIRKRFSDTQVAPAPPADPLRQLRRVSLGLTGLPPTPEQIDDYLRDGTTEAYERAVDRLLASPRYGERWAVHWLDLARYADSNGFQADQLRDNWAYRDWVIRALNDDMPFDEFVVDQLAGDLRPNATVEQRIATGFHRMTPCNVEAGVDPEANRVNQVVDRVNTTATVFLGTTLECAQCHDHKYDPFTQQDYYRLFAYFNNTPLEVKHTKGVTWDFYGPTMTLPIDAARQDRRDAAVGRLEALKAERTELTAEADEPGDKTDEKSERLARLNRRIEQLEKNVEELAPPTTLVMEELPEPRATHLLIRGDYQQPGERVEPGTPPALGRPAGSEAGGNRLDLARWLVAPENPLLARVTVNRWWAELFGAGLVTTLEDFGSQADAPSHPELLDWLAVELIESGWSMKHVLRLIVTSDAYRRSARTTAEMLASDPENRLLARGPRFRLRAETIRDNALTASGLLCETMYGRPIMPYQPPNLWRSVGRNQPTWKAADDENRFRRGIYVVWKRAAPYPSFMNFDAPDRSSCTVARPRSNTPLQALTLLNDPAYVEAAAAFADRLLRELPAATDADRIDFAMKLAVTRPATAEETIRLQELLEGQRTVLAAAPEMVEQRIAAASAALEEADRDEVELAAWFAIAHVLLNLDEFVTN